MVAATNTDWKQRAIRPTAILLIAAGTFTICVLSKSFVPTPVLFAVVLIGCGSVSWIGPTQRWATDAFLLSFATCFFVSALAQLFANSTNHLGMTTTDCQTFYRIVRDHATKDFVQLQRYADAPLAVYFWQRLYDFTTAIGLKHAPWIGITSNSFLVGLAGSVTVSMATNPKQATRLVWLFSLCGLNWLSGSLFLREAFPLLIFAILLRVFTRAIVGSRAKEYFHLAIVVGLSAWALWYLRRESIGILAIYVSLFLWVSLFEKRKDSNKGLVAVAAFFSLVLFSAAAVNFISQAKTTALEQRIKYSAHGKAIEAQGSLGARYVLNQPIPVRVTVGSVYLAIYPIPFWGGLLSGEEYHFIKSCHAVFSIAIFPMIIVGAILSYRDFRRGTKYGGAQLFVSAVVFLSLCCIAATSMESRHLAQFMPAFMFVAAIPDFGDPVQRVHLQRWYKPWLIGVFGVYAAWSVLKL